MFRYQGLLYRAINPVHAREPLSGEGARRHGGRFNPRGLPALYTSRSVMTAVREANQIGTLQPTTLVTYEADIGPLFDAADRAVLAARRLTAADLAGDDWRARMRAEGEAPTQRLGHGVRGCAGGVDILDLTPLRRDPASETPLRTPLRDPAS